MAVTIRDVAKHAGVAPSTVSRVISDNPSISQATKAKVRQAMKELNYYPNLAARSLVNQRSNVIGLVLPEATDDFYQNPFFPTVLRGINSRAAQSAYSILLTTGLTMDDRLKHVEKIMLGGQVDGLIFLYAREDDPIIARVAQENFPFVVIGSIPDQAIHQVDNDNYHAGKLATEFLLSQGRQSIAFVGGDDQLFFIRQRQAGYAKAIEEAGLAGPQALIIQPDNFLLDSGATIAQEIYQNPAIDGLVIADQLVADGFKVAWQTLRDKREIAVITFRAYVESKAYQQLNNLYLNIHAELLGQKAHDLLLEVIADPKMPGQQIKVKADLVV